MTTIDDSDYNLHHIAGLATYEPNTNVFQDSFGGIYQSQGAKLTEIQWTTFGIFVTGNFRFIGDSYAYSNSVAAYDDDDGNNEGRYKDLGNGIWTDYGESINYIVGTSDDVIFGGYFNRVEDISLDAYKKGDADPIVHNIVRYAPEDGTWELLDDPDNVLPYPNVLDGLASEPEGGSSHVYVHIGNDAATLYRWSRDDNWEELIPLNIMAGSLIVDRNGNPAGIQFLLDYPSGNAPRTYSLSYVDHDNDWAVTTYDFMDVPGGQTLYNDPKIIPYQEGILIVSLGNPNWTTSDFLIFDPSTGTFDDTTIPELAFFIAQVVEGNDGDLYASPTSATRQLYYYTQNIWTEISLTSIDNTDFSIVYMTFDYDKNALYVYALDTLSRDYLWFTLDSTSFPPTPALKNPGILSMDGTAVATAVIKDTNDDDFGLWVGGAFSAVGNGLLADNLACFKKGSWRSYSKPQIVSMVAKNQTLIMAYDECASNGAFLPIGTFNTDDSDDIATLETIPVVIGGAGCVLALYSDDNYLFVGGNFTVSIPGSSASANAVVIYNWITGEWSGIGIPGSISSSGAGYQILSLGYAQLSTNGGALNDYIAIGGHFDFTVSGITYHSFALYSMTGEWLNIASLDTDSIINEIIPYTNNAIYLSGRLQELQAPTVTEGVVLYNYTTNSYVSVGQLNDPALAILLVTLNLDDDDASNDDTIIYAGGDFEDSNNFQYGLAGYEYTTQNTNLTWAWPGQNVFSHYYFGYTYELVYQTGGSGQNGTNGNYDVDEDDGGGNGWWITLLIFLILGIVVAAVVIPIVAFIYYKKRTVYQEIN